ncbi:hypothetical protein BGP_0335 [Beggiatoa sp. PS]|nr:hypothetical protein BGP_0335 [Beggiatoa sp. PS]
MLIYTQCGNKLSGKSFAERNFCLKNFSNEVGGQEKDFAGPLPKSLNCAHVQYILKIRKRLIQTIKKALRSNNSLGAFLICSFSEFC